MTRNEALEKINKCIALATNAGATEGEKQNAWAMAEKLASKYGFKIVKQEAPKATDINLNTVNEERKSVEYVVYKVSRFDVRIVSRILYKLGYRYHTFGNSFEMKNDQSFDFEAFKELYKLLLKQYDHDLSYAKASSCYWSNSNSRQFKNDWIFGMGTGLAGEEFSYWSINSAVAGYNAGKKYSSYTKLIRKEVA